MAVKSSSETPSIYITHLTDEVLRRDEKLKQPPQPVGVHLAAESAEAVVPVAPGVRGDVVENLLEYGEEPGRTHRSAAAQHSPAGTRGTGPDPC